MSSDKSGISGSAEASGPCAATPAAKGRVRDRIFETACDLFYRHGIHGVGVDAIAAEAGSNKMSFYRSFASKDALVTEYLREQERERAGGKPARMAERGAPDQARRHQEARRGVDAGLAQPGRQADAGQAERARYQHHRG